MTRSRHIELFPPFFWRRCRPAGCLRRRSLPARPPAAAARRQPTSHITDIDRHPPNTEHRRQRLSLLHQSHSSSTMVLLTLLSDAYHGLPCRRGEQPERYYYTTNKFFEQSLDIYRPLTNAARKQSSSPPPIVALVVGSAWLGHRSILYSGTSWWNSSGPKTVAELGYVCVCVSFVIYDMMHLFDDFRTTYTSTTS